jgi:iron(III) transport system permease protein
VSVTAVDGGGDSRRSRRLTKAGRGDTLAAAALAGVILLLIGVPLLFLIRGALSVDSRDTSLSFENVAWAFTDPSNLKLLRNTVMLSVIVVASAVSIGAVLAFLLTRTNVPGRRAFQLLVIMPAFISPFAGAIAWVNLASRHSGLVNVAAKALLGDFAPNFNIFSFPGMVFVMALFYVPLAYLYLSAAFSTMDRALEESAQVLGSPTTQVIRSITLPLLRPALLVAMLQIFVLSAEMFSIPGLLGPSAKFYTLSYSVYLAVALPPGNWARAAAVGLPLLLVAVVGNLAYLRATRLHARFVTTGGKGAKPNRLDLGIWKWAAFAACGFYMLLALFLPLIGLIVGALLKFSTAHITANSFTLRNFNIFLSPVTQLSIMNSLIVVAIAPLAIVCLGFLAHFIVLRLRSAFNLVTALVTPLPIAIPGIVFGIGVLWTYVWTPLWGTLVVLMIAYLARYVGDAYRIAGTVLVQIDRSLEESGRVIGASPRRVIVDVVMPLCRGGLLSAWVIAAINVLRELNMAAIIYTPTSIVLSVVMFDLMTNGEYQKASAVALFQTGMIGIIVLFAQRVLRVDLAGSGRIGPS